jgi:hypothetical protein
VTVWPPNRIDVNYGLADNRIGAARLDLPDHLPAGTDADSPDATVKYTDR